MSELLQRLLNIARSHLQDALDDPPWGASPRPSNGHHQDTSWDSGFSSDAGFNDSDDTFQQTADSGASAHTRTQGLPHSPELAQAYALLDLPFGTPMEDVSRQWKTYLKKCHPDRFATDPAKQADATELTQALTGAHDRIRAAWKRYRP